MGRKKFDVFLSHSRSDRPWVIRLKAALQNHGLKVWLDKDETRPGESFIQAIEKGLETSKAVALIVSPEAMASGWVAEEYERALRLAQEKKQPLTLIPVILREAEMPGLLGNRNYVDFRDENAFDQSVEELIYGITGKKPRDKRDSGLFDIPNFPDQIERPALLSRMNDLAKSNPVVSVEGLPGSGKTYLVASFSEKKPKSSVLWYHTHQKETLSDLLTQLETRISLTSVATVSKCKELVHILRERNMVLVIDDFQQVDRASYSTLMNIASGAGDTARLVLISRKYVDLIHHAPRIGRLEIAGFGSDEMNRFLVSRGLKHIRAPTLVDLIRKTDGLPLAASLFATLVLDFGQQPEDLLSGNIVNAERFRNWFDAVLALIDEQESKLLHALSVCDGPFNMGLIRKLCKYEKIDSAEQSFENLQRTYLVQKHSSYRWSVHQLIAAFCLSALDSKARERVHLELARYYLEGFTFRGPRVLNEEEFVWKIRACREFQLARKFKESEKILHDVSRTINFRGHYELFIQLSTHELRENTDRDRWIDYHHAHFCLITGKLMESLRVIEPILYDSPGRNSAELLSFARLYAEVLGAMGQSQLALQKLRSVLQMIDTAATSRVVVSQGRATEVWLLTKLGNYDEAKELCEDLLVDSARREDRLGGAIALTHGGIICRLSGSIDQAIEKLSHAVELFRADGNKRGLAWSLLNLTMCQLAIHDHNAANTNLRESLRIYSNIGECSTDYLELLKAVTSSHSGAKLSQLINAEVRRVTTALSDFVQGVEN